MLDQKGLTNQDDPHFACTPRDNCATWMRYTVLTVPDGETRSTNQPGRGSFNLVPVNLRPNEWTTVLSALRWKGCDLFISRLESESLMSLGKLDDVSNYVLQKPASPWAKPKAVLVLFPTAGCMYVYEYIDTKVQALVKLVRGAQQKMCFHLAVEYFSSFDSDGARRIMILVTGWVLCWYHCAVIISER